MVQKVNFNNLTGDTLTVGNTVISGTGVTVGDAPLTGGSGGATQYANTSQLPKQNLTFGEFALVGNTLFITNGVGWYSVALINQSPSLSISVSDISLGATGNTINFTYTASDPDGPTPTVTMTTTANTSQANVTLYTSNSTVTVENLSADDYSANIVLTATDGVDQTFGTVTLTVAYVSEFWDETVLSIGTSSTNGLNNSTFIDRSTNAQTVTPTGTPVQTEFHPYLDNWSVEFDGLPGNLAAGLVIPSDSGFHYGTEDFTIECFVNLQKLDTVQNIVSQRTYNGPLIRVSESNIIQYFRGSGNNLQEGTTTLSADRWYHIALVRQSNTAKIYIDGVEELSFSEPYAFDDSRTFVQIGAYGVIEGLEGYISNVRIVKGTALYTSAFTPPPKKLTAISGTSLLTCQSNRFIDNSTNGHIITAYNTPKVVVFNPFGQESEYAVGENKGSYKNITLGTDNIYIDPHTSKVLVYDEDWTIDFWCYADTFTTQSYIVSKGILTSRQWGVAVRDSLINFYYSTNGSSSGDTAKTVSYDFIPKQWYHIALVNDGATNTLTYYVNGTSIGTQVLGAYFATNGYGETVGRFMDYAAADHAFNGYISDLRIDNGNKVYTSNFTPPTAPVGNTNADLYLPMDNAGIFDKTGNHTLTLLGDASTSTTQTKYADTTMSFDGTGDCIVIEDSSMFDFGSSDFTIEAWLYNNSTSNMGIFGKRETNTQYGTTSLDIYQGKVRFLISLNNSGWSSSSKTSYTVPSNTWWHLALVRDTSNSTLTCYADGNNVGQLTSFTGAFADTTYPFIVGNSVENFTESPFNGYIENFQILKGVAKYTTNFTPPTQEQGVTYQAES